MVFAIKDGLARRIPVKTGISSDSWIEITEGLDEKMEIITGSYRAISRDLNDSMRVRIDNKQMRKGDKADAAE